jgi:hypothetical protein
MKNKLEGYLILAPEMKQEIDEAFARFNQDIGLQTGKKLPSHAESSSLTETP